MKKSLAKAITLTLLLANTAFAAGSDNNVNSNYKKALNGDTSKIDLDGDMGTKKLKVQPKETTTVFYLMVVGMRQMGNFIAM